jgi:aminoglycoside phosphotransferase (APT) family kinase protein
MATLDDADVVRSAREAAMLPRPPLLVLDALETWLDHHGVGSGPIAVSPMEGGHSNLTFRIQRNGTDVVLRRPPRPPLPPGAHDIVREARLMSALEGSGVPVPRIVAICESGAVIGAPFAVMELVEGYVLERTAPPLLQAPGEPRRAGESFIDALVAVHAVDVQTAGLGWLGRTGGYLERQLRRFSGSWEVNRTRQLPAIGELERRLRAGLPRSRETTLVHGDARLGNAIFAPDPPARVAALLDWEMATLGDPLADLGYLNAAWTDPGQVDPPMFHLSTVTAADGFPTRARLIRRYEERSSRQVSDLAWYTALACWKSAIFMEGNYRRALAGSTDDAFALGFRTGVDELAELGLDELRG